MKQACLIHSIPKRNTTKLAIGVTIFSVTVLIVVLCMEGMYGKKHTDPSYIDLGNPLGWMGTLGAVFVFGSYPVLIKNDAVQSIDPMIFQLYLSAGTSFTGLFLLILGNYQLTLYGFMGAAFWVALEVFAYIGFKGLGMATAPAIWSGITIGLSFVYGVMFGEKVHVIVAVSALLAILVGVLGITFCEDPFFKRMFSDQNIAQHMEIEAHEPLIVQPLTDISFSVSKNSAIIYAVCVGVLNGSLMLPFKLYSESLHSDSVYDPSTSYILSFSLGILVCTVLYFLLWFYFPPKPLPPFNFRETALPGFLTGMYWGIANICCVYGTKYLGQSIGYPLTQTAVAINGMWGIYYFQEISSKVAISVFFSSLVIILVGSAVLVLSAQ